MKVIAGFEAARAALSREVPAQSYPVSAALKQGLKKLFGTDDPEQAVKQIVAAVQQRGDQALRELTAKIDRVELASLEVSRKEIKRAYREVSPELLAALKLAAGRIASFHRAQKQSLWHEFTTGGLTQLVRPLERVGLYVPGGTASYPSTVLMTAVPAKVAGVGEIVVVTPPKAGGAVPAPTLVAADIAGVDRVCRIGGAQAVAALAYGTDSIPKVDKICGPGNIFVTLAKKLVYGVVDIDGLAGPSEVLILADDQADPADCAADLLAQAEHDSLSTAVLVTTSRRLAGQVQRQVTKQLADLPRRAIAAAVLERTIVAVVDTADEAIALANLYAPEHLCLMAARPKPYIARIRNAGCIIAGRYATVALGDYVAGPSHVLPTGGTARFGSPLNVSDFMKLINVVNIGGANVKKLAEAARVIACAEGLDAHARAAARKLKG